MVTYTPPTLYDDPQIDLYCRTTGPDIGLTARAVFRELGRYCNPATGVAPTPMVILADALETSTGTIQRALDSCELGGLLDTEKKVTANQRERNVYHFTGFSTGFDPANKPPRGKLTLANYRLREMTAKDRRIADLEAQLAQFVNLDTGEIGIPKKRDTDFDQNQTYNKEEEIHPNLNLDDISFFSSPPEMDTHTAFNSDPESDLDSADFNLDTPPPTFNLAYVRWTIRQYPKWMEKWEKYGGLAEASRKYRHNWPKFTDDDLPRHRDSGKPAPAKLKDSRAARITVECEDCGTAMTKPQMGPSLTDANVKVCGICWRAAFEAHYPDATYAVRTAAENERCSGRAAVAAVGASA